MQMLRRVNNCKAYFSSAHHQYRKATTATLQVNNTFLLVEQVRSVL